jgi:hypothetical protein
MELGKGKPKYREVDRGRMWEEKNDFMTLKKKDESQGEKCYTKRGIR